MRRYQCRDGSRTAAGGVRGGASGGGLPALRGRARRGPRSDHRGRGGLDGRSRDVPARRRRAAGLLHRVSPVSLHTFGVAAAARAIREKVLSPVDLVEALLKRIDLIDGRVQAWALVDRDGARAAAHAMTDEAARGVLRGPLHGVPFGAKDIFYSAGLRTEAGSKVMAGFVPEYDASAVARLKSAGAILLGKLHTTEFATTDPAPTRNPWNLACTPGGYSSGSAAAVAARMVPLAVGTQTIGSIVRPSTYCGIFGLKATKNAVPTAGAMPLSPVLDHVGPMARTVADLALAYRVMSGRRERREDNPGIVVRIEGPMDDRMEPAT